MFRQGDVLIERVATIPRDASKLDHLVLAEGELSGHAHRIAEPETAELFNKHGVLFLAVNADHATVVHDEHAPIALGRGNYRVWMQREYWPNRISSAKD